MYRGPVGSRTEYPGYGLGIDCLLPDVPRDRSDNVALEIGLSHLTTRPRIMADVVWGHPSGRGEAAFRDDWLSVRDWPEATPETLRELGHALPRLIAALEAAVERGRPGDGGEG